MRRCATGPSEEPSLPSASGFQGDKAEAKWPRHTCRFYCGSLLVVFLTNTRAHSRRSSMSIAAASDEARLSTSSPFALSSSVFESSDSDFHSMSSASLVGSSSSSDFVYNPRSPSSSRINTSSPTLSSSLSPFRSLEEDVPAHPPHDPPASTTQPPTTAPRLTPLSGRINRDSLSLLSSAHSSVSSLDMQLRDLHASSSLSMQLTIVRRGGPTLVRDFAYPETDERHFGKGLEEQGKPKKDGRLHDGFQPNWGFGRAVMMDRSDEDDEQDPDPFKLPQSDSAQLFDIDKDYDNSNGDFHPGWYRCLYDFIPEGPDEIPMKTGEVFHLLSRVGPVGWCLAVLEDGTSGIVPEGYVTIERYDADQDDEPMPLPQRVDDEVAEPHLEIQIEAVDSPSPGESRLLDVTPTQSDPQPEADERGGEGPDSRPQGGRSLVDESRTPTGSHAVKCDPKQEQPHTPPPVSTQPHKPDVSPSESSPSLGSEVSEARADSGVSTPPSDTEREAEEGERKE